ncbi:hypothetical protein ACIBSV_02965 [Embleya sp. NPDC050154]|uniref:hypothetical protein n=1 Tax=unclassified Embleya TaxID=2699296 RepID=UPI0037A69E65
MAFEEKRAWIMVFVTVGAYATYLAVVLGRAGNTPLAEVSYASTLLWTIGAAILAAIVLHIVVSIVTPEGANRKDQRDREIGRFGEHAGQSLVVVGAVAALGMALAEWDHFWIANTIYLAFVLSAILDSGARIAAYRWGLPSW